MKKLFGTVLFSALMILQCKALELPRLFSDHMVLQRDTEVRFWGWAAANAYVAVSIDDVTVMTKSTPEGKWELLYPAHAAGGPFEVKVTEGDEEQLLKDVYFGDVWVAGGQSNMEWKINWKIDNWEEELKDAEYPLIRYFEIENAMAIQPQERVATGDWKLASKETAGEFSAVAWFFAKHNHLEKGVPVGIIDSNWGGTPAESWASAKRLQSVKGYEQKAEEMLDPSKDWEAYKKKNDEREQLKWKLIGDKTSFLKIGAHEENYDDSNWSTVSLPNAKPLAHFVWARKQFDLSSTKGVSMYLGNLEQLAWVFINGELVSEESWQDTTGILELSPELLHKGKNTIALRVVNSWNNEVYIGRKGEMWIEQKRKKTSLEGDWKWNNGLEQEIPEVEFFQYRPGMIFNAMIHPIAGYGIKGVIWYQGENNAGEPWLYQELFESMIEDWRMYWRQGRFPFLFVQLANYMQRYDQPTNSLWAQLREAQTQTLALDKTGMACIIDIGDANDIHPRNKKDVGLRLWLEAKAVAYGESLVSAGPMYEGHEVKDEKVIVSFTNVGSGLVAKDGALTGFAVAGADKKYYWANAKIEGNKVILTSDEVVAPMYIRYAWADNPACNLYNEDGLPAVPFRSDANDE